MTDADYLLDARHLKKYYPASQQLRLPFQARPMVHAVDDFSLWLKRGETLGIVGESGCGKSTVGRLLLMLERADAGEIWYRGRDLLKLSGAQLAALRPGLQTIFQDTASSLNPRKSVRQILREPLLYHGRIEPGAGDEALLPWLERVGLGRSSLDKFPHEFSGGQQQRLCIARAISLEPEFLVCDEAVSALDVSVQAQILNLLRSLQRELRLSMIFIAHGLGAVRYVSDRVAVMYLGRLMEMAPAEQLFLHPRHPYTRALIDASPLPDPCMRERARIIAQGEPPSPLTPPSGCPYRTRCAMAREACASLGLEAAEPGTAHYCACPFAREGGQ